MLDRTRRVVILSARPASFEPLEGRKLLTTLAGPIRDPATGHDYYLLPTASWSASEAAATKLGGHLATINDAAENAWVLQTFSNANARNLWIGLNDAAYEGKFTWASGQTPTFRNWNANQPDNGSTWHGDEDYTMLWNLGTPGKWNDGLNAYDYQGSPFGVVEVEPPTLAFSASTKPDGGGRFWIDANGKMPAVGLDLAGAPVGFTATTPVTWSVARSLKATEVPHGKAYASPTFTQKATGGHIMLAFPDLGGGDLDVTASFKIGTTTYTVSTEPVAATSAIKIWGRNPTSAQLTAAVKAAPMPSKWPAGSGFDYATTVLAIAKKESTQRQFLAGGTDDGKPLFNTTNDGGVGLMQVTPGKVAFTVTIADVWDWRKNLQDGIATFNAKLIEAAGWGDRHRNDSTVQAKLRQKATTLGFATKREILTTTLTARQVVQEAVQRYNGGNAWRLVGGTLDGTSGGAYSTIAFTTASSTAPLVAVWRSTQNGYVKDVLGSAT